MSEIQATQIANVAGASTPLPGQPAGGVKKKKRRVDDPADKKPESKGIVMWRSRLSWRITLTVFFTIAVVQVGVLVFTVKNFEQDRLMELRHQARAVIQSVIDRSIKDPLRSPIPKGVPEHLMSRTIIKGIAVYDLGLNPIKAHGERTTLKMDLQNDKRFSAYYSPDGSRYEVVLTPVDISSPYNIVVRLDSRSVPPKVKQYRQQSTIVLFLLAAFVTTVLMLALGQWLLGPLLLLRNNMASAKKNPEDPKLEEGDINARDEIGSTIVFANELIRQNARNLKQMREQAADKIHRLAYYDSLTNLPNRILFISQVEDVMRQLEATGMKKRLAVAAIDLDHFKDINDTMGHQIGDKLLQAVGERLQNSIPRGAFVARSGEDEYAIAMPISAITDDSNRLAELVFRALEAPFNVLNENFQIRASIGIAKFPDDARDANTLLKNADIALNRAKEDGRDMVRYYSEEFDRAIQHRFQMLRDLRNALDADQLTLYYQPQLNLKTGEVIGAEALLRWWRPDENGGGFVSPAEFIPVAEQSGLIVPIGSWVMKTAAMMNRRLHDMGFTEHRIAVNLSAAQFHQSDIVDYVEKLLKFTKIPPHLLELEVTESIFMEDVNHTIETLRRLHALGVELAIDDFGTGYSSLSYLRQFPIDRLKIDQSFTRNALINPDDAAITRTIIRLGHSLGLKVIAEGVETIEHEKFLAEHGCDEVQGFRYSRPIPEDELIPFLQRYNGKLESFENVEAWNPPNRKPAPQPVVQTYGAPPVAGQAVQQPVAQQATTQASAQASAPQQGAQSATGNPSSTQTSPQTDPNMPVARPIGEVHPEAVRSPVSQSVPHSTPAAPPQTPPQPDMPPARPISEAYPEAVKATHHQGQAQTARPETTQSASPQPDSHSPQHPAGTQTMAEPAEAGTETAEGDAGKQSGTPQAG